MSANKSRIWIFWLSLIAIIASFLIKNTILSSVVAFVLILSAVIILYKNMSELTGVSKDSSKLKIMRLSSILSIILAIISFTAALLMEKNMLSDDLSKYIGAGIVVVVIAGIGSLCPKLPFNRYIGMRLPWTVIDEDTWLVAHRMLGYISIPLAIAYLALVLTNIDLKLATSIIILLWIGIPGVLSFVFYRNKYKGS